MSYKDFDLMSVKKTFDLTEKTTDLFGEIELVSPGRWLAASLETGIRLSLYSPSEKAKSEFIVAPILIEIHKLNSQQVSLYSGRNLDVDKSLGLNGECDFIFSKGAMSHTIQTPIIGVVEAKKNDIELGMGQCVAQMVGVNLFNQQEGNPIDKVFGCVTTGDIWQFLKLENNVIFMNERRYYIDNVGAILGVFQKIIDAYKE